MRPSITAFLAVIPVQPPNAAELAAEILALRHQLAVLQQAAPRRLRLSRADGLMWVLSRGWRRWRDAVEIVQPASLGRPPISGDVRALIQKMHRTNPFWGAPHNHGELQKLGIAISETTVAKYLGGRPSSPSATWRTFLRTHLSQCASMDFFTVPTNRSEANLQDASQCLVKDGQDHGDGKAAFHANRMSAPHTGSTVQRTHTTARLHTQAVDQVGIP
jgi:hypothetical protein